MTWVEILLNGWICDRCGIEVLSEDDGLPHGWQLDVAGDHTFCAVCA